MSGAEVSKAMLAQYIQQLQEVDANRQHSQPTWPPSYFAAMKAGSVPTADIWMASRVSTDVSSSTTQGMSSDGASSGGGYSVDSPENSDHSGSESIKCANLHGPPGLESFWPDSKVASSSNSVAQKAHNANSSHQLQHATSVLQAALANWEIALQHEKELPVPPASLPHKDVHDLEPVSVPLPSKFVPPSAPAAAQAPGNANNGNNYGLETLQVAIGSLTKALLEENLTAWNPTAEQQAANAPAMKLLRQNLEKQQRDTAMKVKQVLQEQQQRLAAEALSNALAAAAANAFAKEQFPQSPWNAPGAANLQQRMAALGNADPAVAAHLNSSLGLGAAAGASNVLTPGLVGGVGMGATSVHGDAIGLGNASGFGCPSQANYVDIGGGFVDVNALGRSQIGGASVLPGMGMQTAFWNAQQQAQQQVQQQAHQQAMTHQQVMSFRKARMPPRKEAAAPKAAPKAAAQASPKAAAVPKTLAGDEETLRVHLRDLQKVEPERVVLVRKINRLGFGSPAALEAHYSCFGAVERVLVAHSHVKSQNRRSAARLRPSGLGFIVMVKKEDAETILREGAEQVVGGALIRVHSFKRCCSAEELFVGEDGEADVTEASGQTSCEPDK